MPRAHFHDYRAKGIYHITMNKAEGAPDFGWLSGSLPDVKIARSSLGEIVERNIRCLPMFNCRFRVLQYIVMPDHIHILLQVTDTIVKPMGSYLGEFKVKIGQEAKNIYPALNFVFQQDFYDRIIFKDYSLDAVYQYIRDNPRRLAVRITYPDFFRRINEIKLLDMSWNAYGNIQLLDNPFKAPVVVHRSDSPSVRSKNKEKWMYLAANGGVLVSPFISKEEKAIRTEAESLGGRIILITNKAFSERYKPSQHDFSLCEDGRLLIIAPETLMAASRRTFLLLNHLAENI